MFCIECGAEIEKDVMFCTKCGRKISADKQENALPPIAAVNDKTAHASPKEKTSKKAVLIGIIGLVTAAAVAISAVVAIAALRNTVPSLFGRINVNNNCILYVKDEELFYRDITADSPVQISSSWLKLVNTVSSLYLDAVVNECKLSGDGQKVFFPDKMTEANIDYPNGEIYGYSLYCRNMSKPENDSVKIDSDVWDYIITGDGRYVLYNKGGNSVLYQYDTVNDVKDKVDAGVSMYYLTLSSDEKGFLYFKKDGMYSELYIKNFDGEKEKIDNDVSSCEICSDSLNELYYVKNDSLYRKTAGADKEKIASNVKKILGVTADNGIYYTKSNSSEGGCLLDYVDDNGWFDDLSLSEPVKPEYPQRADYDDYDEYTLALNTYYFDFDQYKIKYEEYLSNKKLNAYKNALKEHPAMIDTDSLYYYDGKDEKIVSNTYYTDYKISNKSAQNPIIIFSSIDSTEVKKVTLPAVILDNPEHTDVDSDVIQKIYYDYLDNVHKGLKNFLTVGDKATELFELEGDLSGQTIYYSGLRIDNEGRNIYIIDIAKAEEPGGMYKISIEDGKPKKEEIYDNDIGTSLLYISSNNNLIYFKDYDERKWQGDLYMDLKRMDYDVYCLNLTYDNIRNKVYYFSDTSSSPFNGTLKVSDGTDKIKIADDVSQYSVLLNGNVMYLKDYNEKHDVYDMYLYKDGESVKIAEDISAACICSSSRFDYLSGF